MSDSSRVNDVGCSTLSSRVPIRNNRPKTSTSLGVLFHEATMPLTFSGLVLKEYAFLSANLYEAQTLHP